VRLRDVVDQLEHVHGLADAGAAEQADLAALRERHEQVDDLDARLQQVLAAGLLVVRRRRAVDLPVLLGVHGAALVLRRAEHVHDAAERRLADRHRDALAGGLHGQAALQALGDAHRDAADDAVAELLLHLERQVVVAVDERQRLVDLRHRLARELDVDDGADDLHDLADRCALLDCCVHLPVLEYQTAAAPPTISEISFVIAA
jgi:peptide chain release factor 1